MKVLVTGASGMLGSELVPYWRSKGHQMIATDLELSALCAILDVRDSRAVKEAISHHAPDLVIHLAAMTDLEECETNPENALDTNTDGTAHVAFVCHQLKIPMVYVSTAGIFDGTCPRAYIETDTPNPINQYGKTKLMGELVVPDQCYIVRAGWMIGGGPDKDHKFVGHIINQVKAGQTDIFAVDDKFGVPTYAKDFAANLLELVTLPVPRYGTYHMACRGMATRYAVALRILNTLKLDHTCAHPVVSRYFADRFWVPRPSNETLQNKALQDINLDLMRPWTVALDDYLNSYDWMVK